MAAWMAAWTIFKPCCRPSLERAPKGRPFCCACLYWGHRPPSSLTSAVTPSRFGRAFSARQAQDCCCGCGCDPGDSRNLDAVRPAVVGMMKPRVAADQREVPTTGAVDVAGLAAGHLARRRHPDRGMTRVPQRLGGERGQFGVGREERQFPLRRPEIGAVMHPQGAARGDRPFPTQAPRQKTVKAEMAQLVAGIGDFLARRLGWERPVAAGGALWVHYGANLGAAQGELSLLSADPELAALAAEALGHAGHPPVRMAPPSQVPSGETRDIHRAGGRYLTLVGSNPWFHHPDDRWPHSVEVSAVARIAAAAAATVLRLTR